MRITFQQEESVLVAFKEYYNTCSGTIVFSSVSVF